MSNHSIKKKPMLYISQPDFEVASAKMQHSFVYKPMSGRNNSIQEKNIEEESVESTVQNEPKAQRDTSVDEKKHETENKLEANIQDDEVKEPEQKVQEHKPKKRKAFKHMNNEEKVLFITNMPRPVPRPKCMINTESDVYQGVISSYENKVVTIRQISNAAMVDVPLHTIKTINIISV